MICILNKNEVIDKYHKIVKCWLLRKFDGGQNYAAGHNCLIKECVICKKSIHKFENFPENALILLKEEIDVLISGNPIELLDLFKNYEDLNLLEEQKACIKNFFIETGYKNWFQKEFAKDFLTDLGINTCVYCNRNYTVDILESHTRAELDHWYPKEKFPILSLSLFNLIPSCHTCNHLKGNGDKSVAEVLNNKNVTQEEIRNWWNNAYNTLNHPYYKEKNEDFIFSFEFDSNLNSLSVNTKINNEAKKVRKTLTFNKTIEIYNSHSNFELKDLYDLRKKYPDTFLVIIEQNFGGIMTKEEAYRMIFGIEIKEEDFHKRPFSKFKKDIIEELLRVK